MYFEYEYKSELLLMSDKSDNDKPLPIIPRSPWPAE